MQADARIILGGKGFDAGSTFNSILTNVGKLDAVSENRDNRPFRDQLMQQKSAINEQVLEQGQGNLLDSRNKRRLSDLYQFASQAKPYFGSPEGVEQLKTITMERIANLHDRQAKGENIDATESEQFLQALNTDPAMAYKMVEQTLQVGGRNITSAGQREFESMTNGMSDEDILAAKRINLGLDPRAGSSALERTVNDPVLANAVVEHEGNLSEAKEGGKLTTQLKFKPLIGKAVKLAEAEAVANSETFTSFKRAKAAFPGLQESVRQLRSLAPIATSTWGGRVFDAAVKETGFGATKGATARAKFIAIINNQVLPLLKETFGAAFTEKEGETLKATMGSPNSTEEEKMAELDAFIEQKMRTMEAQERELNDTSTIQLSPQEELDQINQQLGIPNGN